MIESASQQQEGASSNQGCEELATASSPLLQKQNNRASCEFVAFSKSNLNGGLADDRNAADESVPFIDGDGKLLGEQPPPDRFNCVYLILLLHGIGILLPWNTFLTIGYDVSVDY